MNFHSEPTTVSSAFRPSTAFGAPFRRASQPKPRIVRRPRAAAYIAFLITVFASMAAAAALASYELPLVVGAL